jgi:SAM-dependent methyltransferase
MSECLLCRAPESDVLFRASDRLYRTTQREFSVVRCRSCGLVRLDPCPTAGELGAYYPGSYWFAPDPGAAASLEETYRRLVLRDHASFVERALRGAGPGGRLLDVGCGGGLLLGMMRERGFRVTGMDISPQAAAIAWKRQRVPALAGLLERCPLRPRSFSCVTMFHVLEHLIDPGAYLDAARELLAPGGCLVVQVPNADCWQFGLLGRAWNGVDVPRHLWDFRLRDLERLLAASGFETVRRKHFSLRDNPAGLASSLAPGLDPMARRVRGEREAPGVRLLRDLMYFSLVAASLPFAALEAACGAGATVMVEARPR